MTSLIAVDSRKAEPGQLSLLTRVEKAVECFGLIVRNYEIAIDTTGVPGNLKVGPILEAELYAILLNTLSNAVKSVIAAGPKRQIQITAARGEAGAVVHIRDSGMGLAPEHYEDVFVPFIADPDGRLYRGLHQQLNLEDKYIVGPGSGLGLSIVKEILGFRNGVVRFVQPSGGWKADLEIILP